jgi:hypothetical protein
MNINETRSVEMLDNLFAMAEKNPTEETKRRADLAILGSQFAVLQACIVQCIKPEFFDNTPNSPGWMLRKVFASIANSVLTSLAKDEEDAKIFARQVEAFSQDVKNLGRKP